MGMDGEGIGCLYCIKFGLAHYGLLVTGMGLGMGISLVHMGKITLGDTCRI